MELLPNLGAEEGDDWRPFHQLPAVRTAAHLWRLLFPHTARLRVPASSAPDAPFMAVDAHWPSALGSPPDTPVLPWLGSRDAPTPWLATATLEAQVQAHLGAPLAGPPPTVVAVVHDKAFAIGTARDLDLVPRALDPLVEVLSPGALDDADALVARLDAALRRWPDWTGRRFTLKPRMGSSGRGRVAGRATLDTGDVRRALPRLARAGGAILEPWLERVTDLSVALHVPDPTADDARPTVVGSMEMLTTDGGGYRGHCGEVDARGRVFSGHPADETLRADAAMLAPRMAEHGYWGPCGVDAFTYRAEGREQLRPVVELNARPTMGLVAIGLVRRALGARPDALRPTPGARHGWLLSLVPPDAGPAVDAWLGDLGEEAVVLDLDVVPEAERDRGPRPVLVFDRDPTRLRETHRARLGC